MFVDDAYVKQREQDFAHGGVLRGKELALTFSSLRANDLIWNYVVNNYLKGGTPDAFDLLYWNSDSTNLPGAMFAYYVRNTYLENNLRVPGRLTMCGVPVDLGRITLPAYILATREDHIVPWKTAYQSTQLLGGEIKFVLAASGHIAGVDQSGRQKPPQLLDRQYDAAGRRRVAGRRGGIAPAAGGPTGPRGSPNAARHRCRRRAQAGNANYPAIEPAPGRYVRERCD